MQKQKLLFQPQVDAGGSKASIQKGRRALLAAADYHLAVTRLDRSCDDIYEKNIKVIQLLILR